MAYRLHPSFLATFLLLMLVVGAEHAAAAPSVHLMTVSTSGGPAPDLAECLALELQDSGEIVLQSRERAEYFALAFITEVKDIQRRLSVVNLLITERQESVRKAADDAKTSEEGLEMGKWIHSQSFQGVLGGGDPLCPNIAEEIRRAIKDPRSRH